MMTVRTARLLLRPFGLGDAAAFAGYRSDPEVARYQSWEAPYSVEQARALIGPMVGRTAARAGEWNQVAVELEGELIGDCAFCLHPREQDRASIGFTLGRRHQGKGYATEAVKGLLGELFAMGVERVTADCDVRNVRSQRVLERVGMRRDAVGLKSAFLKGEWGWEYEYEIGREEWDRV